MGGIISFLDSTFFQTLVGVLVILIPFFIIYNKKKKSKNRIKAELCVMCDTYSEWINSVFKLLSACFKFNEISDYNTFQNFFEELIEKSDGNNDFLKLKTDLKMNYRRGGSNGSPYNPEKDSFLVEAIEIRMLKTSSCECHALLVYTKLTDTIVQDIIQEIDRGNITPDFPPGFTERLHRFFLFMNDRTDLNEINRLVHDLKKKANRRNLELATFSQLNQNICGDMVRKMMEELKEKQ